MLFWFIFILICAVALRFQWWVEMKIREDERGVMMPTATSSRVPSKEN